MQGKPMKNGKNFHENKDLLKTACLSELMLCLTNVENSHLTV